MYFLANWVIFASIAQGYYIVNSVLEYGRFSDGCTIEFIFIIFCGCTLLI